MPPIRDEGGGFRLHPVDLAVNKILALAGRNEVRDYVDALYVDETVLPIAGLAWAAVGKDPGFTPLSLVEALRRRGRFQPEEVERLDLSHPFDLVEAKERWIAALDEAESFSAARPPEEIGCLYYSVPEKRFVVPALDADLVADELRPHFGRPGGVLPQPTE